MQVEEGGSRKELAGCYCFVCSPLIILFSFAACFYESGVSFSGSYHCHNNDSSAYLATSRDVAFFCSLQKLNYSIFINISIVTASGYFRIFSVLLSG